MINYRMTAYCYSSKDIAQKNCLGEIPCIIVKEKNWNFKTLAYRMYNHIRHKHILTKDIYIVFQAWPNKIFYKYSDLVYMNNYCTYMQITLFEDQICLK